VESYQMPEYLAVVVEDDFEQAEVTTRVLAASGFRVQLFIAVAPALEYLRTLNDFVDLFVLDRRLPLEPGGPPSDELGDALFRQVRDDFTDTRTVVFTGYASIEQVQAVTDGAGQLPLRPSDMLDRVKLFQKQQSLEFAADVRRYAEVLDGLTNIEVISADADPLSPIQKRMARRLAYEYEAVSCTVTLLNGGLTDAMVWKCQLVRHEGAVANVVIKPTDVLGSRGGLAELLPATHSTARTATVSGLMGGVHLGVLQLAGDDTRSLFEVLRADPQRAVALASSLVTQLNNVPSRLETLTVANLCSPWVSWEKLTERLEHHGITVPPGSLMASSKTGLRHADLHLGNVMLSDEHAVIIDFDSEAFGSGALDPIALLLSTLVHPASPIRGELWPSVEEINDTFLTSRFGTASPASLWLKAATEWIERFAWSSREKHALLLAYCARQLKYDDVVDNAEITSRLLAIASFAARALNNS
jgi:ActR/RegA family two-component response regulator